MKKYYGLKGMFFFSFLAITYFIYNPLALYFLNDDMTHLPLSSKGIFFQRHSFRPIHDLLLITEYKLWGLNARGYHLIEWLIHIVCSVLVYVFSYHLLSKFSKLKDKSLTLASLLSAALFSVYAFHSESVLWLLGSGASLATLFFLLSAIAYMKKTEGVFYFICSLLFFQIGLFTYEAIWAAPFFIGLLSWAYVDKKLTDWKKEWVYPSLYFISFLINILLRRVILGEIGGSYGDDQLFNFNIKHLFYNGVCLFARSFVPPSLSISFFMGEVIVLAIVLFIVIRKVIVRKTFDRVSMILAVSFLCSLLPVLTLGISTHSRESERFLYLPSVFSSILVVHTLVNTLPTQKMLFYVIVLMIYNIYFTYTNARDYKVAGDISKEFYTQFENEKGNDTIVIRQFPRQFNGLPLFRSGFKEGLAWMYGMDTSKILIPDEQEIKATMLYKRSLTKRDFDYSFRENIIHSKRELTFVFDTAYFSMVDFNKK